MIVSGAAAKNTDFAHHDGGNEVYWEDDTKPGFMLLEIAGTTMHTEFCDDAGTMEFARSVSQ